MKRGYLLPPGCKDLSDTLKLRHPLVFDKVVHFPSEIPKANWHIYDSTVKPWKQPAQFPPIKGQVFIPPHTTVKKLAALLGQKPFQIVADVMQLGMFATPDFLLDFKTISKVARMYGFTAIKAV